jgi:hypothetical protein
MEMAQQRFDEALLRTNCRDKAIHPHTVAIHNLHLFKRLFKDLQTLKIRANQPPRR